MPGRTLSTIQSYIDARHTITAHHDVIGDNPCSHYSELDLPALAARLGPDFDLVENHDWFVAQLVCKACGRRGNMRPYVSSAPRIRAPSAVFPPKIGVYPR